MFCRRSTTSFVSLCAALFQIFARSTSSEAVIISADNGDIQEYCQMETFSPRCRHGDVIVMTSARFGRMRIGKCVDAGEFSAVIQDKNTLGCYADVLNYTHRMCSGKSSCDVQVPNRDLLSTKPCLPQLTMYFEASYRCASVVEEDRSCSVSVSTGVRQHIRPSVHDTSRDSARCGSRQHPWMLEAQTGQQINVSLLDFTGQRQDVDRPSTTGRVDCVVQYGYIVDKTQNNNNVSICGNHGQQTVYQSKGNTIEIVMNEQNDALAGNSSFLLAVEAVGCSNIVPPADAWLRRTDNEATIGCYVTRQRWNLRCDGNQWKGTIGVCTEYKPDQQLDDQSEVHSSDDTSDLSLVQVMTILATAFVGLAICLIIVFIGVGCVRRYQQQRTSSVDGRSLLIGYNDEIKRDHLTTDRPRNTVQVVDRQQIYADQQSNGPQSNHPVPQYFVLDRDAVVDRGFITG